MEKNTTVLIVENHPALCEMYKSSFEIRGINTRIAHDGIEALERMQEEIPDVVLLDLMMPNMNGFEFLEKVKELGFDAPILVFSNMSAHEGREKSLALGAKEYLTKSNISPVELIERVEAFARQMA